MGRVRMKAAYTISPDAGERKNRNASFQKRKDAVFSKGNQIYDRLGAEVYMAIKYRGQWYEYSSNPDLSFPLSRKDIVRASSLILYSPLTNILAYRLPTSQGHNPANFRACSHFAIPEPISPEIGSQSTSIPATIVPSAAIESVHVGYSNEGRLEVAHLNKGKITHDPTHVLYDSRQLAPPLSRVGEVKIIQQPIKRGCGRPRGSGRQLQMRPTK
ncbi:hypothetical protein NUW58_g1254 [Xylaria curta]|uniref:Uncharacterized protein n=1 Tax=Xylaria curta TaxID=42375 RepID=A0ACC1PM91_9PEZI|nr:hypothetical protein NUW58_g1254 [Xylaria curta]